MNAFFFRGRDGKDFKFPQILEISPKLEDESSSSSKEEPIYDFEKYYPQGDDDRINRRIVEYIRVNQDLPFKRINEKQQLASITTFNPSLQGKFFQVDISSFWTQEEEMEGEEEDDEKDKLVVVKIVKDKSTFQRETTLMGMMKHGNIIKYFGNYINPRTKESCIVMKYYPRSGNELISDLESRDLYDICKTTNVLMFLVSMAKGLRYLHSLGIIHFDLKPSNVVYDWMNEHRLKDVCLINFGGSKEKISNTLMSVGLPEISKRYASPEFVQLNKNLFQEQLKGICSNRSIEEMKMKVYLELQKITMSSDVFSFAKIIKVDFMDGKKNYLEGLLQLDDLISERKCLANDPLVRPSLDQVIFVLKTNLK